jgi:hypothetical protein
MVIADTGFWLALANRRILSTDSRDFGAYRWKRHEPFENLLL